MHSTCPTAFGVSVTFEVRRDFTLGTLYFTLLYIRNTILNKSGAGP